MKKKKIEHKTPLDEFFYNMQVRKSLIYTATREFAYAKHLYSIPVTDLIDFGMEVRFAFYQLSQLNLAKLFSDVKNQKYNVHRLLDEFRKEPFLQNLLSNQHHLLLTDRLATFASTIDGLHTVRDEWVAHTDVLGGIAPLETFFPTIESLLHFGYEVLDACSQAVLHTPVYNSLQNLVIGDLHLYKK
jgi:hypothetical protein